MGKLQGKVAVITGGNSGMGLETARLFAAEGAKVFITGRRKAEVESAAKQIGNGAMGVVSDVSKSSDIANLVSEVKAKAGHLDIIFANAGVGLLAPFGQVSEEHFDLHFNINVKGLFFSVQGLLPLIRDGRFINFNASVAAQTGMEAFSVYSATKAAVRSFARGWTSDLKSRKIRVNSLSPGPIETPIFEKIGLTPAQMEQFATEITADVPLGRMGRSDEIAKTALFLASDDSSYITGVDLCVDGGLGQV